MSYVDWHMTERTLPSTLVVIKMYMSYVDSHLTERTLLSTLVVNKMYMSYVDWHLTSFYISSKQNVYVICRFAFD